MSYYPPISIKQAIDKIDYKQYLRPAIQREFVWNPRQIELLFDSLMRNYPIGSLLMWKVQGENKINGIELTQEDGHYYTDNWCYNEM